MHKLWQFQMGGSGGGGGAGGCGSMSGDGNLEVRQFLIECTRRVYNGTNSIENTFILEMEGWEEMENGGMVVGSGGAGGLKIPQCRMLIRLRTGGTEEAVVEAAAVLVALVVPFILWVLFFR